MACVFKTISSTAQINKDCEPNTYAQSHFLTGPCKQVSESVPQAKRKRIRKNIAYTHDEAVRHVHDVTEEAVLAALKKFFQFFLSVGYGPLIESLKNEFRRDSSRLQPGDEAYLFRLMAFGGSLHRMEYAAWDRRRKPSTSLDAGAGEPDVRRVVMGMDVFSFNLVIRALETYHKEKKWKSMSAPISVLKEMVHILHCMCCSHDVLVQELALGLMYRLFYASEKLDMLPKLLREWSAGRYPRRYTHDLVELCHIQLKLLHTAQDKFSDLEQQHDNQSHMGEDADDELRLKMSAAASFAVHDYFQRIVTNNSVRMYTCVLELYQTNPPNVNYFVNNFFQRMCEYQFATYTEDPEPDAVSEVSDQQTQTSITLEPMLYNIRTLLLFCKILHDPVVVKMKEMDSTVKLARTVVCALGQLAQKNSLSLVENLFLHHPPHAFGETMHTVYDARATCTHLSKEAIARSRESYDGEGEDKWGDVDEAEFDELHLGPEFTSIPQGYDHRGRKIRTKSGGVKKRWSLEEDEVLKKQFPVYQGTSSVWDVLAQEDLLKHRTPAQIRRRVRKLGLHDVVEQGGDRGATSSNASSSEDDANPESVKDDQAHSASIQAKIVDPSLDRVLDPRARAGSTLADKVKARLTDKGNGKKRKKEDKDTDKLANNSEGDDVSLNNSDAEDDKWNPMRRYKPRVLSSIGSRGLGSRLKKIAAQKRTAVSNETDTQPQIFGNDDEEDTQPQMRVVTSRTDDEADTQPQIRVTSDSEDHDNAQAQEFTAVVDPHRSLEPDGERDVDVDVALMNTDELLDSD